MSVNLGGSALPMTEDLAHEIKAVTAGHGDRREAMPEIVETNSLQSSPLAHPRPDLLKSDKMAVRAVARENILGTLETGQSPQLLDRGGAKWNDPGPRRGVGQSQAVSVPIDL